MTLAALSLSALAAMTPGCGLIFGTDDPVDTKSHRYTVVRLDRESGREWRRLSVDETQRPPTEEGDVAFEHSSSGTIISVNSVCAQGRDASLEELSRYLLLGLDARGPTETRKLKVDGLDALETAVEAKMNGRTVRLKAVVMRKSGCTYDIMYIARPESFALYTQVFDHFLKGFHAE